MPTDYHYMQLPREVIIGKGTLQRIPELAKRLNIKGPGLIIAGHKSYEIAGKTVRNLIEQTGITADTLLVETVTIQEIAKIEQRIKELKPQILFGVGGGTKIDAAKLSSANQHVPFISVPTTVSHDGISSPLASVKGLGKPYSAMAQSPLAIVADTKVIAQAPWRSVVSGCGDVISKFIAVRDWRLAHEEKGEYYGEYAASLAWMSATLIEENAGNIKEGNEGDARVLLEALISCGVAMSIAGSSRPCSGSEHLFSHALDILKPGSGAMHGEQCGLGSIMMNCLYGANWKRMRDTLKRVGAPVTAAELGLGDGDVVEALELAGTIRRERYTILQKLRLSRKDCENVARTTGVIA